MSMLRTKPVSALRAPEGDEGTGLRRRLGVFSLIAFGVGVVIGTGIFTLTGVEARQHAGPAVTISFVVAGVVCLLAALCYAELASSVPAAGSSYTYAYATLGEVFAWIIGWDLVLEFALGAAVVARGWSGYVSSLLNLPAELFGEAAPVNVGAMGIVIVLTGVAVVGISQSARVTTTLVAIKVGIAVFVIVAGAFFVRAANLSPYVPPQQPSPPSEGGLAQPMVRAVFGLEPSVYGIGGVITAAAVVFFAYTGFEAVANLGEETRDPQRAMPRALFGTLGVCAVLYVAVAFVVTGMIDYRQIDQAAPISSAFEAVGATWAAVLVGLAAVAGLTSVVLVDLITMGRIGFAMGRDGLLPPVVAKVHPRWGTPYRITITVAVLVTALAGFVPLTELANMVSIGTLAAFVVVSVAVPVLRRTRPELQRPFRVPGSPVVPILAALACVYLMANLDLLTWVRFGVWLVIGLVIYIGYGRRNSVLARGNAATSAATGGSAEPR